MSIKLLNIGCGRHYHCDWINIDFISYSKSVISHNLLKGIPFENETFDVVYHSHVLEHFSIEEGIKLINECYRVLKKGGILRVAVPDLEQIARNYLTYLNEALEGNISADFKYEWSKIELIDQIARNYSGGIMGKIINTAVDKDFEFIKSRLGMEIKRDEIFEKELLINKIIKHLRKLSLKNLKYYIGCLLTFFIGGKSFVKAFKIGYFKSFNGENHQWMYDRYSLNKILSNSGFGDINVRAANESLIKGFNNYQLDIVGDKIRKPDSLFIEAIKR